MQSAPRGIRPHIALFGRRNVGKSSLINCLTQQTIALVSDTAGTTTDPVYKNMELLPLGPVVLIDTAGLDDEGDLGKLRIEASMNVLHKTDLALVVLEPLSELDPLEKELLQRLKHGNTRFIAVINKCEKCDPGDLMLQQLSDYGCEVVFVSAVTGKGVDKLKSGSMQKALKDFDAGTILGDLVNPGDVVVLVVPIDLAAPAGRLILPQVQTIRELLDTEAITVVSKERELQHTFAALKEKPALVITDSQAFLKVAADVPHGVPYTSFSVLFARYKGDLTAYVSGVRALVKAGEGARILIAESCTHHQMADDIGRVKIPRWLRQVYGGKLHFSFCQGSSFPSDLSSYDLVVQCGGCMVTRREILRRIHLCQENGVAITNYGILIAHLHGVLEDAIRPFNLSLTD